MAGRALPELNVFVLDVGFNTNEIYDEQGTFFEHCRNCIDKMFQRKIFAESKDEVALVLIGTEDTDNRLAMNNQYENVTEVCPLRMVQWDLLNTVQNIKPSSTAGDFLDGMIVALNLLVEDSRGKKYSSRKIILLSNLEGGFNDDDKGTIINGIKNSEIEVHMIGMTLDDDDEEDGDFQSSSGKARDMPKRKTVVKEILEASSGESYTFDEAMPALLFFRKKAMRSMPWNVSLEIGPDIQIPVSVYLKTSALKPKTWKTVYSDETKSIQTEVSYHINDEAQTEVAKDETIPAYRYGRTLVPFSKEDQDAMNYKSEKCFSVLGFTDKANLLRQHYMGESIRIVVSNPKEDSAVALSAFIHALVETSTVAIIRYAYSARSRPSLGFLSPYVKTNFEGLIFGLLPFMEDLAAYIFPPLTAKPKYIPNDKQLQAIDELINSKMLVSYQAEGKQEMLKAKATLNPYLQRLFQNLSFRKLKPEEPLPDIEPHVLDYLTPPKQGQGAVEKIKEMFPLKDVEKKNKRRNENAAEPDEDNETASKKAKVEGSNALFGLPNAKKVTIGTDTPVDDFLQVLKDPHCDIADACGQMMEIIMKTLQKSFGSVLFNKALDCLRTLRSESIKFETAIDSYNAYMNKLKKDVKNGYKEFWKMMVKENVGLITSQDTKFSKVSVEENVAFMSDDKQIVAEEPKLEDDNEDIDELLANM